MLTSSDGCLCGGDLSGDMEVSIGDAAAVLAYLPLSMGIWGTGGFADIVFTVILGTSIICTIGVIIIKLRYKEDIIMEKPGFTEIKPGIKKTRRKRHRR